MPWALLLTNIFLTSATTAFSPDPSSNLLFWGLF